MNRNMVIQDLIKFIEGEIDFNDFWKNYLSNSSYKAIFDINLGDKFKHSWKGTVCDYINLFNVKTSRGRLSIFGAAKQFLIVNGYEIRPTEFYSKEFSFKLSIQPSYVSIEDEDFLNQIIESAPNDLTKTNQKKWIKDKIKSLFLFDKKPPKWIQEPEWPLEDGKPLVFMKQTKELLNDERVFYTFYNPESKKETIVTQFY